LSQKRQLFGNFFGENILKIITSVPDQKNRLQLDFSGARRIDADVSGQESNAGSVNYFVTREESLHGACATAVDVRRVSGARVRENK
jgi:hypothetical protein